MGNDFEEKSKKEINEIIKNMNLSWVEGHPENLKWHKFLLFFQDFN